MTTTNTATLRNAQGSDPSASATATPTFRIFGDGGSATYRCAIDGVGIGDFHTSSVFGYVDVFVSTPLADGAHTFTFDELSPNPGGPAGFPCQPYPFSVDTRVPSAPTITKVTVGTPDAQGNYPLTVTGTVTAGENVRSVRVYAGFRGIGGSSINGTAWVAATVGLAAGSYDLTATSTDPAGNVSPKSAPFHVTVGTPPQPTVPGAPIGGTGNSHSVLLNWTTPADGGSPITGYVLTWSVQAENAVGDSTPSLTVVTKVSP